MASRARIACLLGALAALLPATFAQTITLRTSNDRPANIGDDVTVRCLIENFTPGAAVYWWKRQGSETVQFGTNQELTGVYTDKYSVNIEYGDNLFVGFLNIRGIQAEDNGEFGCATDSVSPHFTDVVVSSPVTSVRLFSIATPDPNAEPIKEYQDGEDLLFKDGEEYYFRCVVTGGNPAPEVQMKLGYGSDYEDLSDQYFRAERITSDQSAAPPALKNTVYEVVLTSTVPVVVTRFSNSLDFRCDAATVNMAAPRSVHITPNLKFPPEFECSDDAYEGLWSSRAEITCRVYADPPLEDIRWYWGDGSDDVSLVPGEHYTGYSFYMSDGEKPDVKIAKLHIYRVFGQMFRKYNIMATNERGSSKHQVTLFRGQPHSNH